MGSRGARGHAAADARMAQHAFVTELTQAFDAELRAAGLVRVEEGRVGTATAWLAFALALLIPPDRATPQARDAIAASVRGYLSHEAASRRGA